MGEKHLTDKYVGFINRRILPFIDYPELQKSYDTDMVYAKGILSQLHSAMVTVYGSYRLDMDYTDDGFVVIPGVVRGIKSGKMGIALLQLDLSSSGEHWSTDFLCKYGVISQDLTAANNVSNNNSVLLSEAKEVVSSYIPYDYCYTAVIPDDIHVNKNRLPKEIKSVLRDFRNHHAVLQFGHETLTGDETKLNKTDYNGKPSVLDKIRDAANESKEPKKDKSTRNKREPEL